MRVQTGRRVSLGVDNWPAELRTACEEYISKLILAMMLGNGGD